MTHEEKLYNYIASHNLEKIKLELNQKDLDFQHAELLMNLAINSINSSDVIATLIKGINWDSFDKTKIKFLYSAAEFGASNYFSLLYSKFPECINVENSDGMTPLTIALRRNYPDMVIEIASCGSNINYHNLEGKNSMYYAIHHSRPEILSLLLEFGGNIDIGNVSGTTVLMQTCLKRDAEKVKILLISGATPGIKNKKGLDALAAVLCQKHDVPMIVSLLLEAGVSPVKPISLPSGDILPLDLAKKNKKYLSEQIIKDYIDFN